MAYTNCLGVWSTVACLQRTLCSNLQGRYPPLIPDFAMRSNDNHHRGRWSAYWKGNTYTNEKSTSLLGWTPSIPMEEGLKRYFEHCGQSGRLRCIVLAPLSSDRKHCCFYFSALSQHPELRLMGVMDKDETRFREVFRLLFGPEVQYLEDVLNDRRVELVINLTNPRSHFVVSKACLEAGKHVYSEKPLAMSFPEAKHWLLWLNRKVFTLLQPRLESLRRRPKRCGRPCGKIPSEMYTWYMPKWMAA